MVADAADPFIGVCGVLPWLSAQKELGLSVQKDEKFGDIVEKNTEMSYKMSY